MRGLRDAAQLDPAAAAVGQEEADADPRAARRVELAAAGEGVDLGARHGASARPPPPPPSPPAVCWATPDAVAVPRTRADGATGAGLSGANVPGALRSPRPPHTSVPVQLVVAEKDRYVSPAMALCVAPLADELVVARVDGGHWLPLTRPERVAELITEHIDRQDRP